MIFFFTWAQLGIFSPESMDKHGYISLHTIFKPLHFYYLFQEGYVFSVVCFSYCKQDCANPSKQIFFIAIRWQGVACVKDERNKFEHF